MDLFRFFSRFFVASYLGIVVLGLMMTAALAQGGDASSIVDFGDLIVAAIQVFGPVVATVVVGFVLFLLRRLFSWLGLKIDERHRAAIEQGLIRAAGYAMTRFEDRARGGTPIDVRSQAIAEATRYAGRAVPDALKHFGIDVSTDAGRARLGEMIESRFEAHFTDAVGADQVMSRAITGPVPV